MGVVDGTCKDQSLRMLTGSNEKREKVMVHGMTTNARLKGDKEQHVYSNYDEIVYTLKKEEYVKIYTWKCQMRENVREGKNKYILRLLKNVIRTGYEGKIQKITKNTILIHYYKLIYSTKEKEKEIHMDQQLHTQICKNMKEK